jgi:MoaA/NifB/PqqE/SkfB family radical SAM enzyme
MHRSIADFIADAHNAGRVTHVNTNGSKIITDLGMAKRLVDSGLSSIKFSFQGADRETYHAMRRVDFFEDLFDAIEQVRAFRGARDRPFIAASTTTTTETPEMIEAFRERMEPLVDHLTIGRTVFEFIDMAAVPPKQRAVLEDAAKNETVVKRHPVPCPEIYDKLTIHWNGDVRVCCNDYSGLTNLGNISRNNFRDIWRHPTIEAYRERVGRKEYSGPLCGSCYDYAELTEGSRT